MGMPEPPNVADGTLPKPEVQGAVCALSIDGSAFAAANATVTNRCSFFREYSTEGEIDDATFDSGA